MEENKNSQLICTLEIPILAWLRAAVTALGGCKCKEHRASLNTIHSHWGTAPPLDPIWRNNSGLSHILEALFWGLQILDINLSVRPFSEDLPNIKSSWVTIPYAPYSGMKLRKWGIPPNQIRAGSLHESCHELRGIYLPCSCSVFKWATASLPLCGLPQK